MIYYTIYKVINKVNGKFYIGKHLTRRLDDNYLGSGRVLRQALRKHGRENFTKEIMFVFKTEAEMDRKEREIVTEEFCLRPDTYNLAVGGQGGFSYINRKRLNNKGGKDPIKLAANKGRRREDVSERLKLWHALGRLRHDTFTGRFHSEEAKMKISNATKGTREGENNSQYGTVWITDGSVSKKIPLSGQIPDGWRKGRTMTHSSSG